MAPRRPTPNRERTLVSVDGQLPDGEPTSVVRRAPFADNPHVGARGQRTQQRILDAALRVFGEVGYHQCGIARITKLAGCSRASFYQYFSGKEDVFRHLAGQVARQVIASTEALDPLTPDVAGWTTIRAWIARHTNIYERYEPVYQAFQAAVESDEAVAAGSVRVSERNVTMMRSKLVTATLPPRQLDPVINLLLECVNRGLADFAILRSAAPEAYPRERVDDVLTDVMHRTLFGLRAEVNVHPADGPRPPVIEFSPVLRDALQREDEVPELTAAGRRTLEALMKGGRDVFVTRGYHRTRVDDVVAAAGVSHGAFYRYFQGKDHLAQVLAGRAMRTVGTTFTEIPRSTALGASPGRAALRRWLRRYNTSQAAEMAMIRVWGDAARHDTTLRPDSAAALDWGRRRLVRFLQPRDFGDVETEALVMVALLSAFGARERSAATIDAAAHMVERGLLGQ
jgi:AcrR family transcriptional regulator